MQYQKTLRNVASQHKDSVVLSASHILLKEVIQSSCAWVSAITKNDNMLLPALELVCIITLTMMGCYYFYLLDPRESK